MKKIIMVSLVSIIIIFATIAFFMKDSKKDEKIKVAEVTHSVFYAPWYVALEKNYFEDLDIEVILTSGANNVIASVLSNSVDIGFCGPEATIYVYKEAKDDYVMSFAGLTKRDGQFLVLRNGIKYDNFKSIDGLTILAGRSGGMPLLNFKNALKNENIKNVNIDSSIDFANLTSAFIAGMGDGVNLFEPNASKLVNEGYGYIASSIGTYSGQVPYTAFNAKKSYIKENKDIIKKFYKGINKGLEYCNTHSSSEIAKVIKPQFDDTTLDELTTMIDNYKKADSWLDSPKISESSFDNLQNILIDNNEIEKKINYKNLIYEVD